MYLSFFSACTTILAILLLPSLAASTPLRPHTGPNCTTFTFPVSISAKNARLPTGFTTNSILSAVGSIGLLVFDSLVTDTFTIAATYCEAEIIVPSRQGTLQLLVHGATYTKTYWSGNGYGDQYSWVAAASKQGYPTLAIDRLGNGDSQHADPIVAVQYPTETEAIHQTIIQIRAGTLPAPLNNRQFSKVIYAGHSYGSIIGNALTTNYPTNVEAIILTGWSSTFVSVIPAVFGEAIVVPAALADPTRFGALPLGYLAADNQAGIRALFWAGSYNETVFQSDYTHRGTITAAEAVTLPFGVTTSSGYTNPVLLASGQHDGIFCNVLGLNLLLGGDVECAGLVDYLGGSRTLYPTARVFDTMVVPAAGHCWQLHYSAMDAFTGVHSWLAKQGF